MQRKRESKKIPVEVTYTPEYEQRFTAAILKVLENRDKEAATKERAGEVHTA